MRLFRVIPSLRLLLGGMIVSASGCTYSTERPFRDDIQTVHVEMFQSKDFRRGLEFDLTEALAKRIEMDTPYRLSRSDRADSSLSGEILSVNQRVLGHDFRTNRPREYVLTVSARWRWKDLRSGEIIREHPEFIYTTSYIPPVGESFEVGSMRTLDGLAERIVSAMENEW